MVPAQARTEVKEILFHAQTIYAATGLRLGLKPMFRESMSHGAKQRSSPRRKSVSPQAGS